MKLCVRVKCDDLTDHQVFLLSRASSLVRADGLFFWVFFQSLGREHVARSLAFDLFFLKRVLCMSVPSSSFTPFALALSLFL